MIRIWLISVLVGLLIILGLIALVLYTSDSPGIEYPSLPPNVQTRVTVDPVKRTITAQTGTKKTVKVLPRRPVVIDVDKDGIVSIEAKQAGWQFSPHVGAFIGNKLGVEIGIDFLYWKRLNLGAGFQFAPNYQAAYIGTGYNVWRNVNLGVSYNTKQDLTGLVYINF